MKAVRPLHAFLLVSFVIVRAALGADDLASRAQSLLEEAAKAKRAEGLSAAIWKDGAIAWEGATGFADVENQVPATPQMVHRIASISKSLTAIGVMQLVEQDKLKLDAPIQTYVPTFPKKSEGDILLWHLLSHTSGIRHYRGAENVSMEHYDSTLAALDVFQNDDIGFQPGTKFRYTTYGYTVLAAAVESASGEKFGDYMQKNVWTPAGMTSTQLDDRRAIVPHRARGYQVNPKGELQLALYTDNSVRYAGGGMLSTASDLVRFAAAVREGKLVKPESLDKMTTPIKFPDGTESKYGFGWVADTWDVLGRVMRHDGGQSGTATDLLLCRDKGIAVAIISNTDADVGFQEVSIMFANLANGTPPPPHLKLLPYKTMAERIKEENEKKAGKKK